jgi:hypothetical protein
MASGESPQMTSTSQPAPWYERQWDEFRCRTCRRLLLKITPDALKPSSALEVKCACKTMNYLMGT